MDKWHAQLKIIYKNENEKTVPIFLDHHGPLIIQKPFYPEDVCHTYLLHPPGGVAGCDELEYDITLNDNSYVLLTSPGYTKFYTTELNEVSTSNIKFNVANGAFLEYLPLGSIFFQGTNTKNYISFNLENNGNFFYKDVLVFGNPVINDVFSGTVTNSLKVLKNNKLVYQDVSFINGNTTIQNFSGLGNYRYLGIMLCSGLSNITVQKIKDLVHQWSTVLSNQIKVGITSVDELTSGKILAHNNIDIEELLLKIWEISRKDFNGKEAIHPRIWNT